MGLFNWFEKRATYNTTDLNSQAVVDQPFSLDGLFSDNTINEEKVLKIPTAKACLELITGTIAQLPVYLYKENEDGSVERVQDRRAHLLNHEANDFLNGSSLKKYMAKDYLLHGATYVAIVEGGNTILELHPLPAQAVTINKRIQNGWRTVGADIVLANTEAGGVSQYGKRVPTFKPHELIIALQDTHDGLTGRGIIAQGKDIFSQALAEQEYTKNLYDRGALPLGLLKTDARLTETQSNALREAWQKLYGGVKNAAKTVVLQEGMEYQALSLSPADIQMTETRKGTSAEICKLFNVPESLVNSTAGKQYVSLEQNNLHFLKTALSPIIVALENSIDRALLLESEKSQGYFFRFDTSELVRSTEKERVETIALGVQGGIFTINEARAKFDLPAQDGGDEMILMPGATTTGEQEEKPDEQTGTEES